MELRTYFSPLLKWWWLILASAVIAAASALFAVSQQPAIYEARATLLIGNAFNEPNPSGAEFYLGQQLARTYTDIIQLDVLQDATMANLGLTWLPSYTAEPISNSQLIRITVKDSSPERAMVVANELANQLIARTPTSDGPIGNEGRQAFISQQLDELEVAIAETKDEIAAKQGELAQIVSARQIADVQGAIRALESKRDTLQANYANMLAGTAQGALNSLTIIEPATLPEAPVGPAVMETVLAAAAIGLSLAVGAAFLLEYLDDTIKSADDVRAVVGLPTLTGIAKHKQGSSDRVDLVTLKDPRAPVSEAYRTLRTATQFANVDTPIRTILITSANPGEGKSITAANLAVVMAQAGNRVLLIDADLRRPVQHRIFGLVQKRGLTDLLIDMTNSQSATRIMDLFVRGNRHTIVETPQSGLYVLPSGSIPPNPAEVIASHKMELLLDFLATRFNYIVIDSPPTLAVTDAVVLSTRADSVLVVASVGSTRRSQLKQAVERLREVNASVAGVVLNRLTGRNDTYYYYYTSREGYLPDEDDDVSEFAADKIGPPPGEGAAWPRLSFMKRSSQ